MMLELVKERGRIKLLLQVLALGDDLCVILSGGDRPHVGSVTLSIPRPSLADPAVGSATTSILNVVGHKDDEAAKYVSHRLAAGLHKNVAVVCGIHVDAIGTEEIATVIDLLREITDEAISALGDSLH